MLWFVNRGCNHPLQISWWRTAATTLIVAKELAAWLVTGLPVLTKSCGDVQFLLLQLLWYRGWLHAACEAATVHSRWRPRQVELVVDCAAMLPQVASSDVPGTSNGLHAPRPRLKHTNATLLQVRVVPAMVTLASYAILQSTGHGM